MKIVLAVLLLLPLSATAQTVRPDLLRIDRDFSSAIAKHGLEGWMSFMSGNTVLSMEPLAPVAGQESIRKFLADCLAIPGVTITLKPNSAHLLPSGQAGYTTGTYDWVMPNDLCHCTNEFRGTYITVWSLGHDAQWKVKSFTLVEVAGSVCGCAA
jgi:ketosteroid isomerase-like protein